jgi:hypothetical protein
MVPSQGFAQLSHGRADIPRASARPAHGHPPPNPPPVEVGGLSRARKAWAARWPQCGSPPGGEWRVPATSKADCAGPWRPRLGWGPGIPRLPRARQCAPRGHFLGRFGMTAQRWGGRGPARVGTSQKVRFDYGRQPMVPPLAFGRFPHGEEDIPRATALPAHGLPPSRWEGSLERARPGQHDGPFPPVGKGLGTGWKPGSPCRPKTLRGAGRQRPAEQGAVGPHPGRGRQESLPSHHYTVSM